MIIAIDPGHGGRDPGAVANGVREADLALVYALALDRELRARRHAVELTRTGDYDLAPGLIAWKATDLSRRARRANTMFADVFVSVHFNASDNPRASGAWVIHAAGSVAGKLCAQHVYRELRKVPAMTTHSDAVFPDASGWVGNRRLAVLRATKMPAILIEFGFLTNAADVRRLTGDGVAQRAAKAVADGLEHWRPNLAPARPVLRRGSTGPDVGVLQDMLQTLQLMTPAQVATGPDRFGPQTEHAVREFQAMGGLVADGIAGPLTWAALLKAVGTS